MESVFSRFESYNFESDARFQEGLRALHKPNTSSPRDELLDLKLFFYNRFVEPIDRGAYKQWTSSNGTRGSDGQRTPGTCARSDSAEEPAETEGVTMSFAEVMKLVQEGKDVPGVKKLDIQPTNQSPAPSQMQRVSKPWEKSRQST